MHCRHLSYLWVYLIVVYVYRIVMNSKKYLEYFIFRAIRYIYVFWNYGYFHLLDNSVQLLSVQYQLYKHSSKLNLLHTLYLNRIDSLRLILLWNSLTLCKNAFSLSAVAEAWYFADRDFLEFFNVGAMTTRTQLS